ncbi:MAG TPA: response regulator transcription factor [Burkholderiaceae bacterium]|nr:response regulator transcription factor [Burkholderiaceae bacterium]HQR69848.1 response regulator transcription factor [Burkholderiaceae bacterium]
MRILLVEDDAMIGESVADGLKAEGYAVDWVRDGKEAEVAVAATPYSLVVLDLGLPRRDGIEVLKSIRERRLDVPVLVMTARDTVRDRVRGLDAGADDYLVKPFDLDELTARTRALLRRAAGRAEPVIERGPLTINPASREVTWRGEAVPLSAREYALIAALAERPGVVLSRAQLEERLYGWNEAVGSNAVEVHIHNVRKKLGDGVIRNVRGLGYTLSTE